MKQRKSFSKYVRNVLHWEKLLRSVKSSVTSIRLLYMAQGNHYVLFYVVKNGFIAQKVSETTNTPIVNFLQISILRLTYAEFSQIIYKPAS